jgi:hypothetical protein
LLTHEHERRLTSAATTPSGAPPYGFVIWFVSGGGMGPHEDQVKRRAAAMSVIYADAKFETTDAEQRRDVEEAVSDFAGSAALLAIECAVFAIGLVTLGVLTTLA